MNQTQEPRLPSGSFVVVALHATAGVGSGQQQQVGIARGLANRPDLILADEPTGELDSATGRQILALFRYIVEKDGACWQS